MSVVVFVIVGIGGVELLDHPVHQRLVSVYQLMPSVPFNLFRSVLKLSIRDMSAPGRCRQFELGLVNEIIWTQHRVRIDKEVRVMADKASSG